MLNVLQKDYADDEGYSLLNYHYTLALLGTQPAAATSAAGKSAAGKQQQQQQASSSTCISVNSGVTGAAVSAAGIAASAIASVSDAAKQAVEKVTGKSAAADQPRARLDVSDSDSDFNLSDDDEDDGGAAAILKRKQEEAAATKKKDKPAARSSIIWDIKPEDDETDMNQVEAGVRAIQMDGLEWQAGERVPVAYGIEKLRIISQVVDDLVATDDLQEQIEQIQGVQSTDIYAFNKV